MGLRVKKIGFLALLVVMVFMVGQTSVLAETDKVVLCEGVEVGHARLVSNKVYVPLRATLEAMNFTVDWNPKTLAIIVKNDYLTTEYNGWKKASINGFDRRFSDALRVIDGYTHISLDMLYESTNLKARLEGDKILISESEDYDVFSDIVKAQKVTALMYHHILSAEDKLKGGWSQNGAVNSLESFEDQMAYINDRQFNTISAKELEDFLYEGKPLPESTNNNNILITFDDGYLSNYINAYPVMKKYKMKGIFFHVTCNVPAESVNRLDILKLDRISLEQMEEMSDLIEHELHTHMGHDKVNGVADYVWMNREEIIEDLRNNKDRLPAYSSKTYFAYPFGIYDEETIEALREADVTLAFTTQGGYIRSSSDPYTLHRFGVFPWVKFEKFKRYLNQ